MSLVTACALLVHYLCILVCTCALPWPMSPGLCVGLPPTSPRPGLRRLSLHHLGVTLARIARPVSPSVASASPRPALPRPACHALAASSHIGPRLPCHASPPVAPRLLCRASLPMSDLASYVGPCFLCRTSPPVSRLASCIAPRLLRRASPPASRLTSCVAPRLLRRTSPPWATYCHSPI
jgi:hypothetical protein